MNLDKDKLELIRDALQLYHREFMMYYRVANSSHSNVRIMEQKVIKLRDDIDKELESNPT